MIKPQNIICDNNIWYGLGDGSIQQSRIKNGSILVATQVNLDEFSSTFTLLNNEKLVRKTIQSSFRFHKLERFEPPPIYLRVMSDKKFLYNTKREQYQIMEFTSLIAKGHPIDDSKKKLFRKFCQEKKSILETVAICLNTQSKKIKAKIKNKKKHRTEDTLELNRNLINLFVTSITKDNGLSRVFDWTQIELFENTLREFFFDLETGAKEATPNDIFDLFQLVYVQPGEKYWTKDRYWIQLIQKAGMGKYLYEK